MKALNGSPPTNNGLSSVTSEVYNPYYRMYKPPANPITPINSTIMKFLISLIISIIILINCEVESNTLKK